MSEMPRSREKKMFKEVIKFVHCSSTAEPNMRFTATNVEPVFILIL